MSLNVRPNWHPVQVAERGWHLTVLAESDPEAETITYSVMDRRRAIFGAALYQRMYNENPTKEDIPRWLKKNWTSAKSQYQRLCDAQASYTTALRVAFLLLVPNIVSGTRMHNIYANLGLVFCCPSTCAVRDILSSDRVADLNVLSRCGTIISYQEVLDYYQGDLFGHPFYSEQSSRDLALFSRVFAANRTDTNSAMADSLAISYQR